MITYKNSLLVAIAVSVGISFPQVSTAYSVCGLGKEAASFKTTRHLLTICHGEASFQMIMTYHDGTGYQRIPVQKEGKKYRGSDSEHNYILDNKQLIIGTDGEPPEKEKVLQYR